jgi:hypothetical protein
MLLNHLMAWVPVMAVCNSVVVSCSPSHATLQATLLDLFLPPVAAHMVVFSVILQSMYSPASARLTAQVRHAQMWSSGLSRMSCSGTSNSSAGRHVACQAMAGLVWVAVPFSGPQQMMSSSPSSLSPAAPGDHERMGLVEMAQLASPSITSQAPNIKQAAAPNQLAPND